MGELTEEQFNVLKVMVTNKVTVAVLPDALPEDSDAMRINHAHHLEVFGNLIALGFVDEITSKFTEAIEEVTEERRKAVEAGEDVTLFLRSFRAFAVNETGVSMFSAPEGLTN